MAAAGDAQADPGTVLVALHSFLSLTSYLPHLPSILQLFAHLQVLRGVLASEAERALTVNAQLQQELVDDGVEAADLVAHGALTATDGKALRRIKALGKDDNMDSLSIQYRRWHLATIFTSAMQPSPKLSLMLDIHFPDPDIDFERPPLYIKRLVTDQQRQTLSPYREEALDWQKEHEAAHRQGRAVRSFRDLTGQDSPSVEEALRKSVLREAEQVVKDYHTMLHIFADEAEEPEPKTIKAQPASTPMDKPKPSDEARRRVELPHLHSRPAHHQHTMAARPAPSPPAEPVAGPSRHRRSLPAPITRSESRSPSPDHMDRVPLATFTQSGGRIRMSLTPAFSATSASPATHSAPSFTDRRLGRTAMFDEDADSPSTGSKRPRPRASLPPPAGPDFTAPISRMGSRVSAEKLKPFPNSKLRRSSGLHTDGSPAAKRMRREKDE